MGKDAKLRWAQGHTLGKKRPFDWRVAEDGALVIRRAESRRKGVRGLVEHRLSVAELGRLARWMADGGWHPLAAGAHVVSAAREDERGLGAFLHRELGWRASATVAASHLAAVMTEAGVWAWNGAVKGMEFRQEEDLTQRTQRREEREQRRKEGKEGSRRGAEGAEQRRGVNEEARMGRKGEKGEKPRKRSKEEGRRGGKREGQEKEEEMWGWAVVARLRERFQEAGGKVEKPGRRSGRQPPPGFDLAGKFQGLSRVLRGRFEACSAGGRHGPEKGLRREAVVREFLAEQLPGRYGVTRGEVVAMTGEVSRQMDVLVYDAATTPVLAEGDGSRVLPVESVYAAVEVKPRLTARGLREAANLRSVKALSRSASLGPEGATGEIEPPVFGAVFSFQAMDHRRVRGLLEEMEGELPVPLWVDCVCVLDDAVVWREAGAEPTWSPRGAWAPSRHAAEAAGEHSLMLFFLRLLRDANAKTLRPPDLLRYAQWVAPRPGKDGGGGF